MARADLREEAGPRKEAGPRVGAGPREEAGLRDAGKRSFTRVKPGEFAK